MKYRPLKESNSKSFQDERKGGLTKIMSGSHKMYMTGFKNRNGLTRPSWNLQSDKDGGIQMVGFSKKLIR
jgi:hypothetical protein